MRHAKRTCKMNRTGSHKRATIANMLKALIEHGQIETTVAKAKYLRSYADRMVTLAKKNTLASRRLATARLQVRYNKLTPKEARAAKNGDTSSYNTDRKVIGKLFDELGPRFKERNGGYTRVIRSSERVGDGAPRAVIEFLPS
ncbi:MAG: 50S ribosomal protein L17 [Simkaniaceae bacterium]|nr:50S ribosomal protein L17 [Simkaniaceae bacterium]